jgi:pilus assembly protein Flp/PilA
MARFRRCDGVHSRITARSEEGATAAEYALMAALIALVIIAAVALLGSSLQDSFECSASHVSNLGGNPADVDC